MSRRQPPLERVAKKAAAAAQAPEMARIVYKASSPEASPETVLRTATARTLPEWASTVEALSEPHRCRSGSGDTPARDAPLPWIRDSDELGKFHVGTLFKGVRLGDMKTCCGWRFGGVAGIVTDPEPPVPTDVLSVCLRCAPRLHKNIEA